MLFSISYCTREALLQICIDKHQIIDTFVANGQLFSNFLFVAVVFWVFHIMGTLKKILFITEKMKLYPDVKNCSCNNNNNAAKTKPMK